MLRNLLQRRLRMEILEDKRPLAANLFVDVVDGDLIVTGDAGDNRFEIVSGSPDGAQYEFRNIGTLGDMIKIGTAESVPFTGSDHFVSGVTGDIIINLGDGSDWVNIRGSNGVTILDIPGDLRLDLGDGDDRITLGMGPQAMFDQPILPGTAALDIAGDLVIDMGAGTDMSWIANVLVGDDFRYTDSQGDAFLSFVPLFMFNSDGFESEFGDDFSVSTGGGADLVSLEDINVGGDLLVSVAGGDDITGLTNVDVVGSTMVSLGAGIDSSEIQFSNLGNSLMVLGSGSNNVFILGVTTTNSMSVITSSGNDVVVLAAVETGTALVSTGSGADEAAIFDSVFDNLLVLLGGGSDTLTIGGTTVDGLALLLGGGGFDTYVDAGGNDILLELDLGFESLVS